ncbi:MAG: leucine-rich repeat protein, partial [Clostridia bacterium]|nr:leucine-rich repeat protein [Clostridia bacterium]
ADWEKVIKGNEWNINCPFTEVIFTKEKTSEGFTFALNDDGNSYTLRRIGTCTDTEPIIPSEYNGLPVTAIASWAFSENDSIVSVVIPDSVTEIGSGAFYHCSSLKKVVLSKNLKVLDNILSYCDSLTEIELPEGITELNNTFNFSPIKSVNFPSTLTKIEGAFFSTALEKVDIPASVTVIGKSSFQCCSELTEVIIRGKASIGDEAFDCCQKLTKVTMNAVTSVGAYAFSECPSLERIVLPDTVTSLGENIFEESAIVDCFFDGNAKEWFAVNRDQFWFNSKTSEGYYIHGGRMWEDTVVILLEPEYSFTLNDDKSSYTWTGSGEFENVIFSSTYNGLPITNFKLVDPYGQSIRKVYFEGTPAEWNAISMSGDTYIIDRAVIYYYSFKEPTACGNFWHFVDGLPAAWSEEGREHTVITTPAVPATCTEEGLTEGKVCSECGFVIAYQNTVYPKGHQTVSENGKAAGARTFGYTKFEYCTVCLTVTSEKKLILPTGISDPAYYSTRYGYDYLGTLEKGEAMQAFYKALDLEAAKFHLNGETLDNENNNLPLINYAELGLTQDEAVSVYSVYKCDHPIYYWISNTWVYNSTSFGLTVMEEYTDGEARNKTNEFVYSALAEYLKIVMNETSEYQIAFGLYDAIVANASYAFQSDGETPVKDDWAHSIIGILEQNAGVCESYAELFHALLNFSGVDSIIVHGLGNGGGHAWNLVKLDDGEWYWYDPTWGEICWEIYSITHTSFCLTDTEDPTAEIGFWTFPGTPFAESHVPYPSDRFGKNYSYALPDRSDSAFQTDDTQLYDTFTQGELEYIVIGYDTVFTDFPHSKNITPPETLSYRGREYRVVFYEY